MKKIVSVFLLAILFVVGHASAQDDGNWDVYMARYEKGAGTTMLNMTLKQTAPNKAFPFVVITGVTFKNCTDEGFPTTEEFKSLYKVSDSVQQTISTNRQSILAGTFTYNCERLDYIYVNDTANVRTLLDQLYKRSFKHYAGYVNIREDRTWEAYLGFLYPNEETREYMKNQKVVLNLQKNGDKLKAPRKVDHWLYFTSKEDRACMITYAQSKGFVVESQQEDKKSVHPFSLKLSRTDKVDVESISTVTLDLEKHASLCHGNYDGWETFIVK